MDDAAHVCVSISLEASVRVELGNPVLLALLHTTSATQQKFSGAIAVISMSKITASNISLEVTQAQVKQFFSFCGRIEDISLEKGANYQTAVITFERASAAKTALLLQDAV